MVCARVLNAARSCVKSAVQASAALRMRTRMRFVGEFCLHIDVFRGPDSWAHEESRLHRRAGPVLDTRSNTRPEFKPGQFHKQDMMQPHAVPTAARDPPRGCSRLAYVTTIWSPGCALQGDELHHPFHFVASDYATISQSIRSDLAASNWPISYVSLLAFYSFSD